LVGAGEEQEVLVVNITTVRTTQTPLVEVVAVVVVLKLVPVGHQAFLRDMAEPLHIQDRLDLQVAQ
jgi:hypothetical protein